MRKLKVGIIIPLRAPETTSNWPLVSKNCKRTLNSVFQSTSPEYEVVLVCHQAPVDLDVHERLHVHKVNLPIPNDHEGYKMDKGIKIAQGAKILREEKVDYLMPLDADDLIHRKLVEWIVNRPLCSGFRVKGGWVYGGGTFARLQPDFDKMCGSSIIHRDVSHKNGIDPVLMGHCWARGYYHVIGEPLVDIPFRAVCKVIGYGQNISVGKVFWGPTLSTTIKKIYRARPIGKKFLRDFGLS